MSREAFIVSGPNHRALRALNYSPAVDALRRAGTSSAAVPIGRVVSELGLGYATVFARIDCAPEHGVELLSQSDMFAAEPVGRWIRRDSMKKPDYHEVRRWQILIAGAGTLGENELYGRPVLADRRLAGRYVGQDTLVLAFDPPGSDLNLYTYAFLASPTGIQALRSTSYGTKILRLRKDLLARLPVPTAPPAVVAAIAAGVRRSIELRELFASRLAEARRVLEQLPEMRAAHEMCEARRARCVAWSGPLPTLNAWNFASTGDALPSLASKWAGRLSDVVPPNGIFRGNRFARIPCQAPHGTNLYSQRDAFLFRPVPRRVLVSESQLADLTAPVGSLLLGGQGTLGEGEIFGRTALVTTSIGGSAISEHLLRIQPHREARGLVYAFLSTHVGLRLVRSTAAGTKLLSLRSDLLKALPIPVLAEAQLRAVNAAVADALDAHEAARVSEDEAILKVEQEVLPQWLA